METLAGGIRMVNHPGWVIERGIRGGVAFLMFVDSVSCCDVLRLSMDFMFLVTFASHFRRVS